MSDHSDTGGLDGSAARQAGHATHSQPSPRSSGHAAHDKHAGHDPEMFRRRFWLSLALTIPLVVTSHMVMDWFGYTLDLPLMEWYGPVLGSIVFWWGGWPFLVGGLTEVRARRPGMMLLISMAISVAYGASLATSLDWLRSRVLVGTRRAGHDHAAGALAGDEGDRPGAQRARCARRAAARRGRPDRRRHDPLRRRSRISRSATWCWSVPAVGCPPTERSSTAVPSWTSR